MQSRAAGEAAAIGERAFETAAQRPELVALVVGSFLAVLLLGALWRRLQFTPGDQFVKVLRERNRVAVLMHPNPDPDAMASALAVAALAKSASTEAVIQYPGQIRHPENRAFETVLDCDFRKIERASELAAAAVVLVDHNEPRGFDGAERVEPYAVVDHHPGNGEGERFTDVRPIRGSCSSILTDYLRSRGWSNAGEGQTVTPTLATALLYGIQSDTTSFTRGCTPAEFEAAAYLFPAADSDSLERIANPQVDSETLEVKAKAITGREVRGSFLVSHVGDISNLDALPTAAEELVRLEGVTVSVVIGECDGRLHLSARSQDDRVHMGKTLETALEGVPESSAGGHARMGGGQAALPASADGGDGQQPVLVASTDGGDGVGGGQSELQERLFAAMNGEL